MSFNVGGVGAADQLMPIAQAAASSGQSAGAPAVGADDDAVTVDTMSANPPPEVSDAVAVAAQAYDSLQAAGQHVHFSTDPVSGRVSAELQDLNGNTLSKLSPSQVLQLAAGGSL